MKLLFITGFLGSGKTTLLLEIVKSLKGASKRIAIIENEVGQIGIDGKYLKQEGLEVQELFGGCICCALSVNLVITLKKLDQLFHPELTIIEPSGIARAGDIVDTINREIPDIAGIQVVTVVDASRYKALLEVMSPLLTSQIQAAQIVAINKTDKVDNKNINFIVESVGQLNSQAKITAISAEEKVNLEAVLKDLM
ncbi:MAG: GTP-binding protein [Desulfobacteraceae bacterium]|nr:cobalamin biosynthesis protein P47K [Desulfobacteraceae bacterium]MBC2756385.1 GTP-binding protein [Desulfobacteraceae bacterium]